MLTDSLATEMMSWLIQLPDVHTHLASESQCHLWFTSNLSAAHHYSFITELLNLQTHKAYYHWYDKTRRLPPYSILFSVTWNILYSPRTSFIVSLHPLGPKSLTCRLARACTISKLLTVSSNPAWGERKKVVHISLRKYTYSSFLLRYFVHNFQKLNYFSFVLYVKKSKLIIEVICHSWPEFI